jgi:hypothetical protein
MVNGKCNRKIKEALKNGGKIEFKILKRFKTEQAARDYERDLITLYQPDLNVQTHFTR